jgi:hypothetical protein
MAERVAADASVANALVLSDKTKTTQYASKHQQESIICSQLSGPFGHVPFFWHTCGNSQ